MELEDLAEVFHLGERLFTADEVPNLTADEQVAFCQVETAAEIYLGLLGELAQGNQTR